MRVNDLLLPLVIEQYYMRNSFIQEFCRQEVINLHFRPNKAGDVIFIHLSFSVAHPVENSVSNATKVVGLNLNNQSMSSPVCECSAVCVLCYYVEHI